MGGATWEVLAAHAADAIAAGHANAVLLVYGSTARADIKAGRRTANLSFGARDPLQFEVPYGHTLIAKYAMAARRSRQFDRPITSPGRQCTAPVRRVGLWSLALDDRVLVAAWVR